MLPLTSVWPAAKGPGMHDMPAVTVSVLQFGTAHWQLAHIQRRGIDQRHGFKLEVKLVANLGASRLAVSSASVDGAVADLLWTQHRYEAGTPYLYLPFSSQIGDILVADTSPVRTLADLVGRRIGVAGGPDSKGWVLLQEVAKAQGIELAGQTSVQYAAPPLLSQALKREQVEVLITYWHFAAKLKAEGGYRSLIRMSDLLAALELDRDLPVLGYVFRADWAMAHRDLVTRFDQALMQAQAELGESAEAWLPLRPLMRADDDAVFEALRSGFVAGMPKPLGSARIADLQQLLVLTGTDRESVLPVSLFFQPQP
ncbi:ABC transporter substrate-binding protein [Marinobacter caseinilyticus]|uniref:ABC transporter substrate-binding protein n=1 Tax=Marinobacter caseinilyticus TaxID=2692195 RepID=UPI001A947BD6|nr:ABC transporter substrate-binding protein [Marinobacter caseinilyticus]